MKELPFRRLHNTLPIFELLSEEKIIIYSPGKTAVIQCKDKEIVYHNIVNNNKTYLADNFSEVAKVFRNAENSVSRWESAKNEQFIPECLTVYISNDCNLNCNYCYSRMNKSPGRESRVHIESVLTAAKTVAKNCRMLNKPLVLVLHGGGEPTYHWDLFTEIFTKTRQVAVEEETGFFSYVATHGMIDRKKSSWLARNFDLIGLSCDGPSVINSPQRRGSVNSRIEETARIILEEGGKFDIRSTITKNTIAKQEIIADYLISELNAKRIRFEPEYRNLYNPFTVEDAAAFADNFINASDKVKSQSAELSYSGVRIHEIHNSFCDINRNTIRLNPDNQIINCFCDSENYKYPFGSIDTDLKAISYADIEMMKEKTFDIKNECRNCINIYHCSRGCPDYCVYSNNRLNDFKCTVNIRLAVDLIKKEALLNI
jgi:uncharacterized protein